MKEWRVLMDYIDYYVYSYDEEKIIIQDGEKKNKAQFVYEQITKTYGISEKKNNNDIMLVTTFNISILES